MHNNSQESWLPHLIISIIQRFSWILLVMILVSGWTKPWLMLITFLCMIGPIAFSVCYGRAWCGNFCPRWSFNKVVLSIISPNKQFPKILSNKPFRALVLLGVITLFTYNLSQTNGTLLGVGTALIKMMVITVFIQIFLAITIHPFAWCKICPMGTISCFIARIKREKIDNITINKQCITCGACKENCPMQIDIPSFVNSGELLDADCMKCRECVNSCSQKCLNFN